MDEIKVLEEIGLKEVSDKTHIEIKHLKYIINMEFDKLNRVNALGFIKIIQREYDVDFDEWLQEAERYWAENKVPEDNVKIFIAQKPSLLPKIVTPVLTVVILGAILYGAYIFLDKKLDFFQKSKANDINYTYEETPVVKEAKQNIDENNYTEVVVDDNNSKETDVTDQNSDIKQSDMAEDKNSSNVDTVEDKKTEDANETKEVSQKSPSLSENKAVILPNVKLWVGVIYLDDGSRDSYLGDGNFTIDLSRDQLITTGHGNFNIKFGKDRVEKFSKQTPMKFIVKDGNLSEISIEEFKKLNKGNLW